MVIDLNKCLGCQTCTVACKKLWAGDEGMENMYWNNVETKPGKGYPRAWEEGGGGYRGGKIQAGKLPSQQEYGIPWRYNYEEVFFEGKAKRVKPHEKPSWGPNWEEDQGAGNYPNAYYFYLPRICNHCTHPTCADACPKNAIYKREEDGIVLLDESRCAGYRYCVEACPYKKIYWNHIKKISQKCIFCYPRVEGKVAPACARQCPGRLRFVGYMDDEAGPIWKLVKKWKVALPLHSEFGTEPNVYYVPPLSPPRFDEKGNFTKEPRIPMEYIISLLGPEAEKALLTLWQEIEKRRKGEESELSDILIARRHEDMFMIR